MNVGIIGGGSLGQAIAHVLEKQHITVRVYDKKADCCKKAQSLSDVLQETEILFLAIPSWNVRQVCEEMKDILSDNTLVILCSKGLEQETCFPMPEIFVQTVKAHDKWGVLSGPMLATELLKNKYGYAMFACDDVALFSQFAGLFEKTKLIVSHSTDIQGVTISGVCKNIYSIGLGALQALPLGDNSYGTVFSFICSEMFEIIMSLGGEPETVFTVSGIGDLQATSKSASSHNASVGRALVKEKKVIATSEGIYSLPSLITLLGDVSDYPVLMAIDQMVKDTQNAKRILESLLTKQIWM